MKVIEMARKGNAKPRVLHVEQIDDALGGWRSPTPAECGSTVQRLVSPAKLGREIALGGVHGEMVNQGPDRRRQATPGREDDVKNALLAAPIREHMNKLAIAERLPADMVGQERDA